MTARQVAANSNRISRLRSTSAGFRPMSETLTEKSGFPVALATLSVHRKRDVKDSCAKRYIRALTCCQRFAHALHVDIILAEDSPYSEGSISGFIWGSKRGTEKYRRSFTWSSAHLMSRTVQEGISTMQKDHQSVAFPLHEICHGTVLVVLPTCMASD